MTEFVIRLRRAGWAFLAAYAEDPQSGRVVRGPAPGEGIGQDLLEPRGRSRKQSQSHSRRYEDEVLLNLVWRKRDA